MPTLAQVTGLDDLGGPQASGTPEGATQTPGGDQTLPGNPQPNPNPMFQSWMLLILGVFVFMILMQIMAGRKDRKRRQSLMDSLSKNQTVITTGGIIGSIVEVKDDSVLLRVDESSNTKIRFRKSAVADVMN